MNVLIVFEECIPMSHIGLGFRSIVCAALLSTVAALAQQPAAMQDGPIPPPILAAKKIFVSNPGDASSLFSGGPNRAYSEFYAALKAAGQFELVGDPSNADLVLEIQIAYPGTSNDTLRLTIYDRKSHYVLWTLSVSINPAGLQKSRDREFDAALSALVVNFETLAGKAPSAAH
jgi:hypothetical protein